MKLYQPYIFLCVIVGIAVAATLGVWLQFPINAPIHGIERHGSDPMFIKNYLAAPFLVCFSLALLALFGRQKRLGGLLLAGAIVSLLSVPLTIWLRDTAWLKLYIDNSVQYDRIQFITIFLGHTPSSNGSSYSATVEYFHYLGERGAIVLKMLSWGWLVCLIGAITAASALRYIGRGPSLRQLTLYVSIGIAVHLALGFNTLRADMYYRAGDQRLGVGAYPEALSAYAKAFELDPMLKHSRTFLGNVSKAFYQLGDPNDPRGQLYLANSSESNFDSFNALLVGEYAANDGTALGLALSKMARRAQIEWLVTQSLRAYKNGQTGSAATNLRRALSINDNYRHVRYFLAHILIGLREFDEADQQLRILLSTVDDKTVLTTIYNSLGDVQSAAGHTEQARDYYSQSYNLDKSGNLWAMKGLGGT